MKFTIITLFPKSIKSYISESIIKRAIKNKNIKVKIVNLRDFSQLKHNQVDDYQFGGGKGMVLMVEPIVKAIEKYWKKDSYVILTSPQGKTWNQQMAKDFKNKFKHIILICGHYEGFDERILDFVDQEISIGDYVLTGGEIPSLVILDSITRLIDGVIAKDSHENESFEDSLLDYSVYTKPIEFRGKKVPDVLLSGHHSNIKKFRDESRLINTFNKRKDLLKKIKLSDSQLQLIESLKKMKGEK